MADHDATQPANGTAAREDAGFRLNNQEWIVIALIALSIIGVGVTDFASAASHW